MSNAQSSNPLDMLQSMWNQMGFQLPGMVAPTLDEGELDKQIRDLRSVENWLRMNLSMLQMTIQNLEMQRSALGTFRSMSEHFSKAATGEDATPQQAAPTNPFFSASGADTASVTPETTSGEATADQAALAKAAMWPWEMMNELNATVQAQLADADRKKARTKPATKRPSGKATAQKATAKRKTATTGKK